MSTNLVPVSDNPANGPEYIDHAAATIGRGKHRRAVFDAIYAGKKQSKSVAELSKATGLNNVRVLQEGGRLAGNGVVIQERINGETAYKKIRFYQLHKGTIASLLDNPKKRDAFPTKRRPAVSNSSKVQVIVKPDRARIRQITIDDISSFNKAATIKSSGNLPSSLSEKKFKEGVQAIIGQAGKFTDWGGEKNDLFSTRTRIMGNRVPTAFAFKGPGTKGKLTPGKLGKNGDQIQRLFETAADAFLIQFWQDIDESVLKQMETHAIARSVYTGQEILYGIIDGDDSNRIYTAYKSKF